MDEADLEPQTATSRWATWLGRVFAVVAVLGVLIPMVLLVANVIMRTFGWGVVPSLYEVSGFAAAIVGSMGFGYAAAAGGNVATTILTSRLKGRAEHVALTGGLVITLLATVFTAYALVQRAIDSYEFDERLLGAEWLMLWPARMALFLGIATIAVVSLDQIIHSLRARPQTDTPGEGVAVSDVAGQQDARNEI